MSDIFDEVDDILSEVNEDFGDEGLLTNEVVNEADLLEAEKSFNESELQDIMAEIESLEEDFVAEETVVAKVDPIVVPIIQTELQTEIDRELEMSLVEREEEELAAAPKVLAFDKKPTPVQTTTTTTAMQSPVATIVPTTTPVGKTSEISFEAHGQMNLNLAFKIGQEDARLTIDPVQGLVVTMSGVKLCISQDEGCLVTMDNGVKFTIPLTESISTPKKKSA